jgi:CHAT domain-containing protein
VGIIPHQVLHYVPFTALTDGETYLGQQHTLFSLPSAGVLRFIQENAANLQAPTQPPFIIGNPETNGRLPTLLHATNEATSIASLLDASAYTGAEASETQLRDNISGASVVHLAAHGEYNVFNQYYSAIHLAQPLSSQDEALLENEDGHLEVHEIYGLDLRSAELVVLSACQTNIGEITQANRVISAGDEIVGLTRAFFFAGTPTVISSLWNVDDAATEQLMVAFYENWQTGMDSAEALQAAQAELRQIDNGKYASPFYWAGFVLSGEPGHVTEYQPSSPEPKSTLIATAVPELISSTLEPDTNSRSTAVFGIAMIVFLSLISLWGLKRFRNRKKKGCG